MRHFATPESRDCCITSGRAICRPVGKVVRPKRLATSRARRWPGAPGCVSGKRSARHEPTKYTSGQSIGPRFGRMKSCLVWPPSGPRFPDITRCVWPNLAPDVGRASIRPSSGPTVTDIILIWQKHMAEIWPDDSILINARSGKGLARD